MDKWEFEKIKISEMSKIEKIIKLINEHIINNTSILTISSKEIKVSFYLKESDKVKLHYDYDSLDIDAIEFELNKNYVSPISKDKLEYLYVEYSKKEKETLKSATLFLKDKTTSYDISFY